MYSAIFSRTYPMTNIAEVLDVVAAEGWAGIQANLSSAGLASLPQILPPGIAAEFGSQAKARDLQIAALSGTYNMAHPDAAVRLASRVGFAHVVRAAREMGAPIVTLCTGSRNTQDMWKSHPDNATEQAWSDLRAELDFALELAEAADISLAIEPEPGNVVCDARAAVRLVNEVASDRLGIILDAANLLTPETLSTQQDLMNQATGLLGGSIVLAHAKDLDVAGHVVAPGEGAVDLVAFARALRAVGYDGALVAHGFEANKTAVAAKVVRRIIAESA